MEPLVLSRDDGPVTTLTLNRGARVNPLSSEMIEALRTALAEIAASPTTRVVILAAAGRGFCAGHDLSELRAHAEDASWQARLFDDCAAMMLALTQLPQPVIARVHGVATAAGCQLVSMCDLAVASDAATFALPGIHVGLFCSTPAVGVVRNVARKRVMEMLLTGAPVDAATARDWGLVNRVVPAERLDAEIRTFTDAIVARSSAAIGFGKRAFYEQIDQPLGEAYRVASDAMVMNAVHPDARAGMDGFLSRRASRSG